MYAYSANSYPSCHGFEREKSVCQLEATTSAVREHISRPIFGTRQDYQFSNGPRLKCIATQSETTTTSRAKHLVVLRLLELFNNNHTWNCLFVEVKRRIWEG
jgi:hypothetical protein